MSGKQTARAINMRKILIYQAIVSSLVILGWLTDSQQAAVGALFGSAIALTNSGLLAWRMARVQRRPAGDAYRDLRSFYFAALERFAIVIMLFAAGLGALNLPALPLLSGFIAGQLVLTILSFRTGLTSHGK